MELPALGVQRKGRIKRGHKDFRRHLKLLEEPCRNLSDFHPRANLAASSAEKYFSAIPDSDRNDGKFQPQTAEFSSG